MKSRILVLAAALLLAGGAAQAETFDFYVFTYCPTADPLCGFASQQSYRDYMLDAVQNMNLEWERVGISFRPVIFNIQANDYYGVMQGCDGDVSQTIKDRRQEWKANVAGVFPNAVSVAITPGGNWCCSHIPGTVYGNPQDDVYPALFGMFCSTSWDSFTLGSILGHEAGHYFCLVHTQTFQDPATHPPTPDHDNDDCCNIGDTNPDPARREGFDPDGPGGDLDINDNPVNGHEWCSNQPLSGLTDDGSPHPQLCQPTCFLYSNNVLTVTGYQPPSNASMSYYMAGCHGPYVVNGQVTYAFGNDSVDQVRNVCIPGVPERTALPDVCAGHGGDTDHDGICNAQDNCPGDKNTSQKNTDGDADADACDLCPLDPNPTGDQDGDGVGDICDPDKDGDTCDDDTIDEDPDSGKVRIGYTFNSDCGFGIEPVYANASVDSDFDGIKGCQDVDNDNDGICDGAQSYGPGAPGAPPQGCTAGPDPCTETAGLGCYAIQGSPTLCPPSWLDCLGSGCLEFFLKIVSVINPADQVVLDGHFSIANRTIYTAPFKETTLGQTGKALGGDFAAIEEVAEAAGAGGASPAAVAPSSSPVPVRLEIWKRGGVRSGDRLVAVVGEYDPSQVMLGDLSRGALLEITPTMDAAGAPVLEVKAAYADVPPSPVAPLPDADGDRRPDLFDNCIAAANFLQNDADGDGFGNACDADIDGDLMVGDTDVAAVRSCLGADLAYDSPIGEPGDDEGVNPPDDGLMALKMRCEAMDLDDDTRVGPEDESIAVRTLGLPPGPSSKIRSATRCEPADCDDGKACTHDWCDTATGECRHLPGGCDDGDPCTTDSCDVDSGACRNVPVTCDDGNRCTRDFCDRAAGGCTSAPEPDGLPCDDGSRCTEGEVCRTGECGGGTPRTCDDGDPCTADACDPATGECVVTAGTCDDGNPCTRDTCDPRSGACTHDPLPDGEPCSDGDACTVEDLCRDGACAGQPKTCDDGVLCTADLCLQPSGQCASAPMPCDDGDACTIDTCVASTGECAHLPVPFAQATSVGLTGPFTVMWAGPAGAGWNSYRGTIPSSLMATRRGVYDHVCLESLDFLEDGPTMSIDPGMPEPGTAFYYAVTERNDCGEGPPGFDWTGAPRPNIAPCVAGH
jgi:hypothetical protein